VHLIGFCYKNESFTDLASSCVAVHYFHILLYLCVVLTPQTVWIFKSLLVCIFVYLLPVWWLGSAVGIVSRLRDG
jgi:hypothetical protein